MLQDPLDSPPGIERRFFEVMLDRATHGKQALHVVEAPTVEGVWQPERA